MSNSDKRKTELHEDIPKFIKVRIHGTYVETPPSRVERALKGEIGGFGFVNKCNRRKSYPLTRHMFFRMLFNISQILFAEGANIY